MSKQNTKLLECKFHKDDCFAYYHGKCLLLKSMYALKCNFYRSVDDFTLEELNLIESLYRKDLEDYDDLFCEE